MSKLPTRKRPEGERKINILDLTWIRSWDLSRRRPERYHWAIGVTKEVYEKNPLFEDMTMFHTEKRRRKFGYHYFEELAFVSEKICERTISNIL